jgi:hypothetical protein
MSNPFAAKTPQSLAANSGKAVMVKPALEILALTRRSWASALAGKLHANPMIAISCGNQRQTGLEGFRMKTWSP